jgi:hypothetical protein
MQDPILQANYLISSFIISVASHNQDLDSCEVHPHPLLKEGVAGLMGLPRALEFQAWNKMEPVTQIMVIRFLTKSTATGYFVSSL